MCIIENLSNVVFSWLHSTYVMSYNVPYPGAICVLSTDTWQNSTLPGYFNNILIKFWYCRFHIFLYFFKIQIKWFQMKFFTKGKIKNLLFTQSNPLPKKKFLNKTRTKKNKTKRTLKKNPAVPLVTLLTFVAVPNLLLHILYFLTLTFVVQSSP